VELRQLPGTDIRVSEISFGAGPAAGLMVNGDRAAQREAVEAALEVGINHFDTAPLYGSGCSEVNLGATLREVGADVLVTSKFHLPAVYLTTGSIASRVRQSVQESLTRLRRDHIDILLMHNATHFRRNLGETHPNPAQPPADILPHVSLDDLLGPGGVWETVQQLRSEGLVRYFGVSGQDNDPAAVRALIGAQKISVFNQPFNLLNPSAGYPMARAGQPVADEFVREQADFIDFQSVMEFARANGVGVSVISPVAAGALTTEAVAGEPPPGVSARARRFPRPGQYEREVGLARRFVRVAEQLGVSLTELAYQFALSAPGVTTVVGGFSTSQQLRQAAQAASRGPLTDEALALLRQAWGH
jgi:aryl-alcohol dehydrogenase-like predicted oxidoreductase